MKRIIYFVLVLTSIIWSDIHFEVISDHNGSTYILDNDDIVFTGDKLTFSFGSDNNGTVNIFSGKDNNPIYSQKIEANKTYYFPGNDKVLVLDNTVGIEEFIVTLNDKIVKKLRFNHISREVPKKEYKKIIDKNSTAKPQIIDFPSLEDREYTNRSNIKTNTRSAIDKKVFKELSNPTVIVKSDQGLGAGIVISKNGDLLTNWHLVQNKPYAYIAFKPKTGNKPAKGNYYLSRVIKADQEKDLAQLHILNTEVIADKDIKPIAFSDIKNIEVGEDIYTIGHPAGYYYNLDKGIVGNILNDHSWQAGGIHHKASYIIKTQNQISGGNSGGPLVNKDLQLLGLMTFSDTRGQNLNFAVSIKDIKDFLHSRQTKLSKHEAIPASNESKETALRTDNSGAVVADVKNAVDTRGNPIIIQRLDTNHNDVYDIIMIDTDKDGKWDRIGYDRDEDGIIEKWSTF